MGVVYVGERNMHDGKGKVGTVVEWIAASTRFDCLIPFKGNIMNSIVYLVGAVVIILAILSFVGLR